MLIMVAFLFGVIALFRMVFFISVVAFFVSMFVVRECDVVCSELSVDFDIVCVFFFVDKFYSFVWTFRECLA